LLILAEFCFASASVFVKIITSHSSVPAIEITFFRFLVGFFFVLFIIWQTKISIIPNKLSLVIWRAVLNTAAVIFFFMSAQYTTITNANMLNMTYPVFIFFIAPLLLPEKTKSIFIIFLIFAILGIYFIVHPSFSHINIGDIYGLISGIISAFAIITLRKAREYDSTTLILFYLMTIGFVINGIIVLPFWVTPKGWNVFYCFISAILGVAGQAFITAGYKYITAKGGSLISSSRIIFAVLLGVIIFSESLGLRIIIGGILILGSLIGVGMLENKRNQVQKFT
jgi:drug/metabolite transporter (DMT)-like permease